MTPALRSNLKPDDVYQQTHFPVNYVNICTPITVTDIGVPIRCTSCPVNMYLLELIILLPKVLYNDPWIKSHQFLSAQASFHPKLVSIFMVYFDTVH